MARSDSGLLIVFEGIDGAGKTTQVENLRRFLLEVGELIVHSKEPTDGVWGRKIRRSAANGRMPLSEEIEAFIEDRKEHVREIVGPALAQGKTVILDRYFYSTIAYQGSRGGNVEELTSLMEQSAPVPDLVIFLDVFPEIGLSRVRRGRGETPNAFEKEFTLDKARDIFVRLSETHPNFVRIDGADNPESVRKRIFEVLVEGLLKKKHCEKAYGCDDPFSCMFRATNDCRWVAMRQAARLSS